ncbi:hypothetical protein [Ewingella americana]|uniref:Uncharacterized protein n=1 Tax=Ewingella americana TaxID=41202 RepID=A0A502G1M1_9GAMM|nr:hypothetical protein [Ewingella americana]TPG55430.1 hypothetical protein EAH77_23710 [Ewingella americana]
MKINFLNFFKKENSLQRIYPRSLFKFLSEQKKSYPFFLSLEGNNIYAYSTRFMVKSTDVKKIEDIVKFFFRKEITQKKECLFFNGMVLHFFKFEDFHQIVIDIITNNNDLIKDLCNENLEPPAPHVVFPDGDFEALGSLQGEMELWWNVYWLPFWTSLSEEEKEKYLERNKISSELREFLILHS